MEAKKKQKVPWTHLEKYLEVHQAAIVTYMDQQRHKLIKVEEIEEKLPNSFLSLHDIVTKILKDNDIFPAKDDDFLAGRFQILEMNL